VNRLALSPFRPALRLLLGPIARPLLCARLGRAEGLHILDRTWELYPTQLAAVGDPARLGLGPALVMRLAACTIALHAALVEGGTPHGNAVELAGELAWAVYRRMGQVPWLLSGIVSRDPGRRLDLSTRIFRRFPFGPSAYVWESKPAPDGIIAFDCLRCPVAEYFSKVGLAELCVRTFCDLDFPLAADWAATLVRGGSIAAGAPVCDFCWKANSARQRSLIEHSVAAPAPP
jgi:hypothetical protein